MMGAAVTNTSVCTCVYVVRYGTCVCICIYLWGSTFAGIAFCATPTKLIII